LLQHYPSFAVSYVIPCQSLKCRSLYPYHALPSTLYLHIVLSATATCQFCVHVHHSCNISRSTDCVWCVCY